MKRALHIAIGTLLAVSIQAQETSKTEVTYDLTAETAVGTGDFTAYQLVSNRHHVLSTRANTGYVRGALNVRHPLGNDFLLSGGVDAIEGIVASGTHAAVGLVQYRYAMIVLGELIAERI